MQYRIYKDNVKIKETTSKQVEIAGLKPKTAYTIGVSAYNGLRESTRATITMTTRGLIMIVDKALQVGSEVTFEYVEYPIGVVPIGTEPAGLFGGGNRQTIKGSVVSIANGQSRVELKTSFDKLSDELKLATNLQVPGLNLLAGTSEVQQSVDAPTSGWAEGAVYNTTQPLNENQYILSFEARGDVDNQRIGTFLYSGGLGGGNISKKATTSLGETFNTNDGRTFITLTTEWKRYWVLYDVDPDNTKKAVIVGRRWIDSSPSGKVYVRKVKLEVGKNATPWAPARQDVYGTNQLDAGYSGFDGYKAIYLK